MTTSSTRAFVPVFLVLVVWAVRGSADEPPKGLSLAEKGYWTLLNKPLSVPFAVEAYDSLWKVWPEPLKAKAEKATPRQRRKMALDRYGFQELPNRELPLQFTPAGDLPKVGPAMAINCFLCHGGKVEGKVIPGLANSHLNMTTFTEDIIEFLKLAGGNMPGRPDGVPAPALPPVRGVSNAFADALSLLIVRDRDLEVTGAKLQFPAPSAEGMDLPIDAPALWLAHRKKYLYHDGFIEKNPRDIMQFSFDYRLPGKMVRGWEEDYKTVYAWIESLRAPKYPGVINANFAERGHDVFNNHCARCHGKYGNEKSYPERLIDVEDIGTDPVRSTLSVQFKKHLGEGWVGDYGKAKLQLEGVGYVAPPLDGVWATAPYLHNGSVPTLWHLLNPGKRPAVWLRTEDGYDHARVGLKFEEFDRLPDAAKAPQQRRLYYQSELRGLGNQGHRYPKKGLSEDETRALLEYLKTI